MIITKTPKAFASTFLSQDIFIFFQNVEQNCGFPFCCSGENNVVICKKTSVK